MLDARVLRVGLDPLELGLGPHALDFELGDEDRHLARRVCDEGDRPLGREKAEAREVLDVVLVEEHVAAQPVALHVLQEPRPPVLQLYRRNPCCWLHVTTLLRGRARDVWGAWWTIVARVERPARELH